MKNPLWLAGGLASVLFGSTGLQSLHAQLPSLNEQPWLGYFGVFESKRCEFAVAAQGKVTLTPTNEKGVPVGASNEIRIVFGIEEVLPDGKTRMKEIKPESLESPDPATDNLEKAVIRGKVTGDAAFEAWFEQERGIISIGGRVTDSGTLTKNPLRFAVRLSIPNVYTHDKKEDKKDLKVFLKKIKNDRLDLKWTDGKRLKETFEEPMDLGAKEINGPGIAEAELQISAYKGKTIYFSASENSAITLSGKGKPTPLHEGFTLNWVPDAAKDPQGKSRLRVLVK